MNWKPLTSVNQIPTLIQESKSESNSGILIFKHSTRCSVSFLAKKNIESDWNINSETLPTYYLDLIQYRGVSNQLAETFDVMHESPQILLIADGICRYFASHSQISVKEIENQITN
ncbi:MAG: bacillithiol system redox-active protein YtxJ [Flavobacteriales bacterium]|nr:bacillithiol system redox-active protein YtxJ [Flavobacteriales bacterium]